MNPLESVKSRAFIELQITNNRQASYKKCNF